MQEIKLSELKTDETISNLIPEMTKQEFLDLKTSIEENGLRHEIDINADNTILDGRHRVRVMKSLGFETIPFKRHDLSGFEAVQFARDTAIERRSLSDAQRRDVVLRSEEIVSEIQRRARENQIAGKKIEENHTSGSIDPKVKVDSIPKTNTAEELAKIAQTSPASIKRSKKLMKENPEGYQRVLSGESSLYKEYSALPTVKTKPPRKKVSEDVKTQLEVPVSKKKQPVDLRDVINNNAATGEELKMLNIESEARHLIELCDEIVELSETATDYDVFVRFVSTLETSKVTKAITTLKKLLILEETNNVRKKITIKHFKDRFNLPITS